MVYFASLHERFLDRFTGMSDDELSASSTYWESVPMELRFRLHRFDSHLRQHTIQMEKTRQQIKQTPPEAQRLLRLIFNGLAEVQAISLGSGGIGQAECDALAGQFDSRRLEIEATLKGEFRPRPPD